MSMIIAVAEIKSLENPGIINKINIRFKEGVYHENKKGRTKKYSN
ncbi:hypothetical protein J2Z76_001096 [Sedimentibacter acidaminivorans]|uniref:Transposase n=1 Tax=Sedimentibacter acidaminivorans TaxID=913099 RepID=A0ABS4GC51_9FIRM|nr:hypothetical protein [Sedimentibacter acidaminivorans]MBP1925239.1 hypothetical protein [Sedimentibacter acidaminivorans]